MTDPARRTLLRQALVTAAILAVRSSHATDQAPRDDLMAQARVLLMDLHARELAPFLEEWPSRSERRDVPPASVPVLRWLPDIQQSAATIGRPLVNALVAATEVIIPLQCEYFGMKGMQLLHNTIERVRVKLNPTLRISGILATIHKSRTLHSQEVLELVRERYGDVVFDVVIKDSIRFAETPLAGMSILQYAGSSEGANAYRALAKAVIKRAPAAPVETKQPVASRV